LVENLRFNLLHLCLASPSVWPRCNFAKIFSIRKLEFLGPGLSYGVDFVILGLAIFVEHQLTCDGWSDGRTDEGHMMTAYTALA